MIGGEGPALRVAQWEVSHESMHAMDLDGMRMCWLEEGRGDPVVVLVHGIPTGPLLWRRVMPELRGARVIAWEMVGYGKSIAEGRTHDISVAAQARYLRSFLRALGVDRALLVGHDLGGGVVQIAALQEPSLCQGLLLTNAIGYDSWPVTPIRAAAAMGPLLTRLPKALFERVFIESLAPGYDRREIGRESATLHWGAYEEADGAAAFVRQARALDARDTMAIQDALPTLRGTPARIVWGAADPFQKLQYGRRLAQDLNAPLEIIDGAKHFTPECHPEVLVRTIHDLCEEVRERHSGAEPPRD